MKIHTFITVEYLTISSMTFIQTLSILKRDEIDLQLIFYLGWGYSKSTTDEILKAAGLQKDKEKKQVICKQSTSMTLISAAANMVFIQEIREGLTKKSFVIIHLNTNTIEVFDKIFNKQGVQ